MKLRYTTRVYEGPKTREGVIELGKAIDKTEYWTVKIYLPDENGEIYELRFETPKCRFYTRLRGIIKPGKVEISTYKHNKKGLEKFLANYIFNEMKGGKKNGS